MQPLTIGYKYKDDVSCTPHRFLLVESLSDFEIAQAYCETRKLSSYTVFSTVYWLNFLTLKASSCIMFCFVVIKLSLLYEGSRKIRRRTVLLENPGTNIVDQSTVFLASIMFNII